MAPENYVRKVGAEPEYIEIIDVKAFSTELTKALADFFRISKNTNVPVIPVLTQEEYFELKPEFRFYCLVHSVSCFDEDLKSVMIANTDKHNPLVYGEELTHALVCHTRPGTDLSVDEFFGQLGQQATYKLLKTYQPQLHLTSLEDHLDWFNRVLNSCKRRDEPYYKIELERKTGALVADIAASIALKDKKLFSRSDEEIKRIYFEPVLKRDWPWSELRVGYVDCEKILDVRAEIRSKKSAAG
jgi:hypothetical protein